MADKFQSTWRETQFSALNERHSENKDCILFQGNANSGRNVAYEQVATEDHVYTRYPEKKLDKNRTHFNWRKLKISSMQKCMEKFCI